MRLHDTMMMNFDSILWGLGEISVNDVICMLASDVNVEHPILEGYIPRLTCICMASIHLPILVHESFFRLGDV